MIEKANATIRATIRIESRALGVDAHQTAAGNDSFWGSVDDWEFSPSTVSKYHNRKDVRCDNLDGREQYTD